MSPVRAAFAAALMSFVVAGALAGSALAAPESAPFLPGEKPDAGRASAHLAGGADCGPCIEKCDPDVMVPCERAWKLKLGFALSSTSGNTDTFSLVGDVLVTRIAKPWTFKVGGAFVYQENEGDTTAERYAGILRVERDLDQWTYAFAQLTYDKDEPAGLDYRWTPTAGLGRVLWRAPDQELKAELGGGMTIEKRLGLEETSDPSGYVGVHYWKSWADSRKFTADLDFTPNLNDFDLSVTRLVLAYSFPVCTGLSIVAGARFDWVIAPPDDREELDTLLLLGVSYEL